MQTHPGMDTQSAKSALAALWTLVYAARTRALMPDERREVYRLCEFLKCGVAGRKDISAASEELCLSIFSSGLTQTGISRKAERLLQYIDAVREMMN